MSDQDIYFDDDGDADAAQAGGEGAADDGAGEEAAEDCSPEGRYESAHELLGFDDDQAIQLLYALYNDAEVPAPLRSKALRRAAVAISRRDDVDQIIQTLDHVFDAYDAEILTDAHYTKTIHAMVLNLRHSDEGLGRFLEHATEKINRNALVTLYIDLRLQQCELMLKFADYDGVREYLRETDQFCPIPPPPDDREICRAAIRLLIVRIELADVEHDEDLMFSYYEQAMSIPKSSLSARQSATLTHIDGIRALRDGDYATASIKFYEAFQTFNEMGLDRRIRCLPYVALASMLAHDRVNKFLAPEVMNFVHHPLVAPLAQLRDAYQTFDIVLFNRRLDPARKVFTSNPEFYSGLLDQVRLYVLAGALKQFCRKYRRVEAAFVAAQLASPEDEVRRLALDLILADELNALLDPDTDLIYMVRPTNPSPYLAGVETELFGMENTVAVINRKTRLRVN
jgi:hypothetical protein